MIGGSETNLVVAFGLFAPNFCWEVVGTYEWNLSGDTLKRYLLQSNLFELFALRGSGDAKTTESLSEFVTT